MVEGLKIIGSWDNWKKERAMIKTYNSLKGCEEKYFFIYEVLCTCNFVQTQAMSSSLSLVNNTSLMKNIQQFQMNLVL